MSRRTSIAPPDLSLREAWEAEAGRWIAWARAPGHDSYWQFHRDAFFAGLPAPPLRVVDIGCGEGRVSRDLKARGDEVIGVDGSATLIAAAREADPGGTYLVADAAAIPLPAASADLAIAFMSPQDIDDLDGAMREAARILVPGGHVRMAIVHPLNSAGRFTTDEPAATFEVRGSYLDERRYADTFERDGLAMTFVSHHRSLQQVARAVFAAGLLIDSLAEPPATNQPPGDRWRRLPLFLHVGAVKPPVPEADA
jgi:SAM-dependent methyltransferase